MTNRTRPSAATNASDTVAYYDQNAEDFIEQTKAVDLSDLHARFLAALPSPACILDAGSGAGRDALTFKQRGHEVFAIDASIEMVKATRALAGVPTEHTRFLDYQPTQPFDGIWACASLLHVPMAELPATLTHLASLLNPGGMLFASFKHGTSEEHRNDRFFRDLDAPLLEQLVTQVPALTIQHAWITQDARPGREHEAWLNALLRNA